MGRPSDAGERLIGAAREVMYASSYEAATVDELCATAGVTKSSFYHFFASKQDLLLAAMDSRWEWMLETILKPAFANDVPPQERILRFFDVMMERQQLQKDNGGHMRGCPLGNLTLEMSTQDEVIRSRVEYFFDQWLKYVEGVLRDAKEQGVVPSTLDTAVTARALLAYFEGVVLLAKGRNDPALMATLRSGVLSLMQYQERSAA
jgi:TetR/AcrR family transcriptional regulator, transcriptional repressor for nem operon